MSEYQQIQQKYLKQAWERGIDVLEEALPAKCEGNCLHFKAFGEDCEFCPQEIKLSGQIPSGPEGVLTALYAIHAQNKPSRMHPRNPLKNYPTAGLIRQLSMHAQSRFLFHMYRSSTGNRKPLPGISQASSTPMPPMAISP